MTAQKARVSLLFLAPWGSMGCNMQHEHQSIVHVKIKLSLAQTRLA
jgi:hypothetical protein